MVSGAAGKPGSEGRPCTRTGTPASTRRCSIGGKGSCTSSQLLSASWASRVAARPMSAGVSQPESSPGWSHFQSTTRPSMVFRGTGGIVTGEPGVGQSPASRFLAHPPVCPGIHRGLFLCVALHEEAGAVAHLGNGSFLAEVPHHGSQDVRAGVEQRGQVDGFKAPVEEVAARRTLACVLPVDVKDKAVIGAYVDPVVGGHAGQGQLAAEVEDAWRFGACRGAGDPGSRPMRGDQIGIERTHRPRIHGKHETNQQASQQETAHGRQGSRRNRGPNRPHRLFFLQLGKLAA